MQKMNSYISAISRFNVNNMRSLTCIAVTASLLSINLFSGCKARDKSKVKDTFIEGSSNFLLFRDGAKIKAVECSLTASQIQAYKSAEGPEKVRAECLKQNKRIFESGETYFQFRIKEKIKIPSVYVRYSNNVELKDEIRSLKIKLNTLQSSVKEARLTSTIQQRAAALLEAADSLSELEKKLATLESTQWVDILASELQKVDETVNDNSDLADLIVSQIIEADLTVLSSKNEPTIYALVLEAVKEGNDKTPAPKKPRSSDFLEIQRGESLTDGTRFDFLCLNLRDRQINRLTKCTHQPGKNFRFDIYPTSIRLASKHGDTLISTSEHYKQVLESIKNLKGARILFFEND